MALCGLRSDGAAPKPRRQGLVARSVAGEPNGSWFKDASCAGKDGQAAGWRHEQNGRAGFARIVTLPGDKPPGSLSGDRLGETNVLCFASRHQGIEMTHTCPMCGHVFQSEEDFARDYRVTCPECGTVVREGLPPEQASFTIDRSFVDEQSRCAGDLPDGRRWTHVAGSVLSTPRRRRHAI